MAVAFVPSRSVVGTDDDVVVEDDIYMYLTGIAVSIKAEVGRVYRLGRVVTQNSAGYD